MLTGPYARSSSSSASEGPRVRVTVDHGYGGTAVEQITGAP